MSKSRSGKVPYSNQSAQPIAAQNAIIPGKFMESDWNELLETEDNEDYIAELIDEIADNACNQVFDKIIESRVQPHTVLAVRELLLQFIEWQFLLSDPGEKNKNETSWIEDEEPVECAIDNWAQGAVPVSASDNSRKSVSSSIGSEIAEESSNQPHENEEALRAKVESNESMNGNEEDFPSKCFGDRNMTSSLSTNEKDYRDKKERTLETYLTNEMDNNASNHPLPPPQLQKRLTPVKQFRPYEGSLPKFQTISLESVTDERPRPGTRVLKQSPLYDTSVSSELLVRNRYGRSSGPKEVVYDEQGTVVKVEKLNVANFPKHRVPVKFSILDTEKDSDKFRFKSVAKRKKERLASDENKIDAKHLLQRTHPLTSWHQSPDTVLENNRLNNKSFQQYSWEQRSPLPPLMVDAMDVTDGVTIREGGLSKQVIKKTPTQLSFEKRSIQPLSSGTNRILEVKDIVSDCSPSVMYLQSSVAGT